MSVKIYSAYNPPPKVERDVGGPSMARQEDKDSVDINKIVAKYHVTGVLPPNRDAGIYADVSQMGDYRTAVDQVMKADELFMQLPSDMRKKFDNDAAAFLDFVSDDANHDEMVEMGLVAKPSPEPSSSAPAGAGSESPGTAPEGG